MAPRDKRVGVRFYLEVILGAASVLLFAVTLIWKDWIEIVFKVDPDEGNGSVEYLILGALVVVAAASWWLARTEWRRVRTPAMVIK